MSDMRLRYLFLYFLAMSSIAPTLAQDVPGSSIVSRTFLSPDGPRKAVRRVYDNGLGDVVQEIQSYTGTYQNPRPRDTAQGSTTPSSHAGTGWIRSVRNTMT